MIGGALGEARGDLMPGFVEAALKTPYKLRVPLAPAEGLVLESQVWSLLARFVREKPVRTSLRFANGCTKRYCRTRAHTDCCCTASADKLIFCFIFSPFSVFYVGVSSALCLCVCTTDCRARVEGGFRRKTLRFPVSSVQTLDWLPPLKSRTGSGISLQRRLQCWYVG